jgi:hypothetical protein
LQIREEVVGEIENILRTFAGSNSKELVMNRIGRYVRNFLRNSYRGTGWRIYCASGGGSSLRKDDGREHTAMTQKVATVQTTAHPTRQRDIGKCGVFVYGNALSAYGNTPSVYGNALSAYVNDPSAHVDKVFSYVDKPSAYMDDLAAYVGDTFDYVDEASAYVDALATQANVKKLKVFVKISDSIVKKMGLFVNNMIEFVKTIYYHVFIMIQVLTFNQKRR